MARFGFIHDKLEIKFLILYIMSRAWEPLDLTTLTDLTLCDDGIDYFEFMEALSELVDTEHLLKDEDLYTITEKGKKNGVICESSLPYSIRMRADHNVNALNARLRRNAQVKATRTARPDGGFTVHLSLDDDFENILTLELLAPSESQADRLEENFRCHPQQVYQGILDAALHDYKADNEASFGEN